MGNKNTNAKTDEKSESETYRQQPSNQWRTIFNNVWHKINSTGLWANFHIGLIFLFLSPLISLVMNNYKIAIYGAAFGLTILIWTVAIITVRQISPLEIPENSKPTLKKPTFTEDVKECFFDFGTNTAKIPIDFLEKQPMQPFNVNGISPVMYVKDHIFYVDVIVSDPDKLLPVEIKEGDLTVKPAKWDSNSNDSAFEVVDEKLDVVFQIIYHKPSKVFLYGVFPDPQVHGQLIFVSDKGIRGAFSKPNDFAIKRHFKYPSWKYPGQFDEP